MEFAKDLVSLFDGKPMTTSRLVAKKFGKRHDNVLQLFNSRIVGRHSDEFVALNFQVNEYGAPTRTRAEGCNRTFSV